MWKLSDETIMEWMEERHQHRRRFQLEAADTIRNRIADDGWIVEDLTPKSSVVRPIPIPGRDSVPEIHIRFEEEA